MENKKLTRTAKFDFIIKAIFSVWLRRFEALETDNRVIINKKLKLFKRIANVEQLNDTQTNKHLLNTLLASNVLGACSSFYQNVVCAQTNGIVFRYVFDQILYCRTVKLSHNEYPRDWPAVCVCFSRFLLQPLRFAH